MGIIGGKLAAYLLKASQNVSRWYYGGESKLMDGSSYAGRSKMEVLLGSGIWSHIKDRSVLDFGCGFGDEVIEIASHGAAHAVGLDIDKAYLEVARTKVNNLPCKFVSQTNEKFDVIFSIDAFEHYNDPDGVLRQMANLLKPDGKVIISFGPTWYHPLGGHLFSIFPWCHLVFSEQALIRLHPNFIVNRARNFQDFGLNQMTVHRFIRTVEESSPFRFEKFEAVPIRALKPITNRLTREFTTSIVRCVLELKDN